MNTRTLTAAALAATMLGLAAVPLAQAQEAVPPNDWTHGARAAASAPAAAAPATRAAVRATLDASRPSPFADSWPARGSLHRPVASTMTHAEVQAELQIYRESGLAALDANDGVAYDGSAYRAAQARQAELRSSPYYASLVQRYGSGAVSALVAAVGG